MSNEQKVTNKKETTCSGQLLSIFVIYILVSIILLPFYKHQINPDGISYINSAYKFLKGDIYSGITGHWSPLLSCLIIPFLKYNIDSLLSVKIVSASVGMLVIGAIWLLLRNFNITGHIRTTLLFSAIPITISFAYGQITPDLLNTGIFLLYFYVISDRNCLYSFGKGILAGFLGGCAYLSKHYSFPLFLSHFFFTTILYYVKTTDYIFRKRIVYNFLSGITVFFIISSPYIFTISKKYGGLMISTTGYANYISMSPMQLSKPLDFFPPPDISATSIWDDPHSFFISNTLHIPWSPFDSFSSFQHLFTIIIKNIFQVVVICICFSPVAFMLSIGHIIVLLRKSSVIITDVIILHLWSLIIFCSAGYCIARIGVEDRYIMLNCFSLMLLSGYALKKIFKLFSLSPQRKAAVLFLYFTSFSVWPMVNIFKNINAGRDIHITAESLRPIIPPMSKIAASNHWYESLFLAFHLKSQIFGTVENMLSEKAEYEMNKYDIQYFIDWENNPEQYHFLSKYQEVGKVFFKNHLITIYQKDRHNIKAGTG